MLITVNVPESGQTRLTGMNGARGGRVSGGVYLP
jgi:hypothetical protein